MEMTNISNLKNRLSEYLRKVREGETVVILDRDRPIARIECIAGSGSDDERLSRLEAQGLVSRPTAVLPDGFFTEERPRSQRGVLEALLEEREESR